jgi:hypothetical protein
MMPGMAGSDIDTKLGRYFFIFLEKIHPGRLKSFLSFELSIKQH